LPGYGPGGEANIPADWPLWITDTGNPAVSLQGLFGNHHFQIIVSANSGRTLNSFSIAENAHRADVRTSAILSSVAPNLRPFKQQGGS
jgi:feruloyl esterase